MTLSLNKTLLSLILFFSAVVLYANTLSHGFVWDDHYLIENNSQIRNLNSIPGFFTKDFWKNTPLDFESGFYRPVVLLSYFANDRLWGGQPFGFHLFNILLHALNGVLVFRLFEVLTKNLSASFLSAAFFIVHPILSETVSSIANVGDLLVVTFLLLSLLNFIALAEKKNLWYQTAFLCFFALALLSKENAMAGMALFILVDWLYGKKDTGQKIPNWIGALAVLGVYLALRLVILGKNNVLTTLGSVRYVSILPAFDFWSHILTTIKIVFLYLKLLVFPVELSISHIVLPAVSLFSPEVFFTVICPLALAVLTAVCALGADRHAAFGLGWFFVCLLPVSNLIPISNTIAERFLYLPSVGFCFLAAYGFDRLWQSAKQKRFRQLIMAALLISIFSWLGLKTTAQSKIWHSDFTLFSSAVSDRPCAPIAHLNLSAHFNQNGDFEKGAREERRYQECLEKIQEEYRQLRARVKK